MVTRRRFIGAALGAGAVATLPGCQQMGAQPQGKRIIVDSQVHIWDRFQPGMSGHLPDPFPLERLLPILDEAGVERAIIVPPGWQGPSNEVGMDAVRRYPRRFGIMGQINFRDQKTAAALLPGWKSQPGMLGIRLTLSGNDAKAMAEGSVDWLWPAAEKYGIPIHMVVPEQGPALARVAERHPGLKLIIVHMGLASAVVAAGRVSSAIDQIMPLARFQNVSVVMSSVPTYSKEPYPFRDFYPHLKRVFEAYGPRRCHFGTDLTSSLSRFTYRQRITHFTETLDFMSEPDKDWVMGRAILDRLNWA